MIIPFRSVGLGSIEEARGVLTGVTRAPGPLNHSLRTPTRWQLQTALPVTVGIAYAIATDSTDRRHALGAGAEGAAGLTSTRRAPLEILRTRRSRTAKDGRHSESGTRD